MERCSEVFDFVSRGQYPEGFSKSQKLSLKRYAQKFTVNEGQLFYRNRRVIQTRAEAQALFTEFHSSPAGKHAGIIKTRSAICSRFYWVGMSVDIDRWVSECDRCQVRRSVSAAEPPQSIKVSAVWELVGIDLLGPFPKTQEGFQFILTATDYFSKWVEAFPLRTKAALEVAQHLCAVVYRHGCPKRILSDQGTEFVNELNSSICALLSVEKSVTAAYHPQTNTLDEETSDNVKRVLTALVTEQQSNWDVFLDAALFSLRSQVHSTTKLSPFVLMYGREAVPPSEVPVDVPLSTIVLPDESAYCSYLEKKKTSVETVKPTKNISTSQEKQKKAPEKRVLKKKLKAVVPDLSITAARPTLDTFTVGREGT